MSVSTQPITALREHATALEAAISVCLADPKPKAVHHLRSETRRIQAVLELLGLMHKLPHHRSQSAKLLRETRKLRRAAGRVRDLDVERKLIKERAPEVEPDSNSTKRAKSLSDDLEAMRERRKERRERLARKLVKLLASRQAKITHRLEALLRVLKPASETRLIANELLPLIETWFKAQHAIQIRNPSTEHLHDIRKAAKTARYMAELAPDVGATGRVAARYHQLQEAGGLWHDWLALAAAAADELGDHHSAAAVFAGVHDQYLEEYRDLLEEFRSE